MQLHARSVDAQRLAVYNAVRYRLRTTPRWLMEIARYSWQTTAQRAIILSCCVQICSNLS